MDLTFAERALELCFKLVEETQNFVLTRLDFQQQIRRLRRRGFVHGQWRSQKWPSITAG